MRKRGLNLNWFSSHLQLRTVSFGPVDVEELSARLVQTLVGVRAKVVALGLEQVGGQTGRAVTVVVRKGGAERRRRHATLGCERNNLAPIFLRLFHRLVEVGIKEQIGEVRIAGIGLGDLLQKGRANDTTAAPDLRDLAEVESPVVFLLRGAHELKALGVRADLRAIERIADGLHDSPLRP